MTKMNILVMAFLVIVSYQFSGNYIVQGFSISAMFFNLWIYLKADHQEMINYGIEMKKKYGVIPYEQKN